MDKQKQIQTEELIGIIQGAVGGCATYWASLIAEEVLKYYQPKIPEGAVVLTEAKYSDLISDEVKTIERDIAEYWATEDVATVAKELHKEGYRKLDDHAIWVLRKAKGIEERIRKEMAEKFAELWKKRLSMYSHIHQFAKDARQPTEVYADGEPVEMESVWDVLTLKKNGYDDYETMEQLQDNIEYIAKSRLLREIDRDIDEICEELSESK